MQEDRDPAPAAHAALVGLHVERPGVAADLREELKRAESNGTVRLS